MDYGKRARGKRKSVGENPSALWVKMDVSVREALRDITPTQWLIYCLLATYVNSDGVCYPSMRELAKRGKWSKRWVGRALKELEAVGWIVVERSFRKKGWHEVNRYHLTRYFSFGDS